MEPRKGNLMADAVDRPEYRDTTNAARQSKYRTTDKGREAKRKLEDGQYLSRPFIGWDSEGITDLSDGSHRTVLFANSLGHRIVIRPGERLSTSEAFGFILAERLLNPSAIHVWYGGGYDTNMLLGDLPHTSIEALARKGSVWWDGWHIEYRKGKLLRLTRRKQSVTVYDVISFFQCSFIKACDSYLGTDWLMRDEIVRMKAERSTFEEKDIESIITYNDAENANLVRLMEELRLRLFRAGLIIRRWDGPGAVASSLMAREAVKPKLADVPSDTGKATRTAYAGGRFEVLRFGHYVGKVYEYDVNSAYPAALRNVPCLAHGSWQHVVKPIAVREFAVYRIRWSGAEHLDPGPLWVRNEDGTICYPTHGEGWYWSPEAQMVLDTRPDLVEFLEAWEFIPGCDEKPFAFIDGLYLKRQALKRTGDGAHVGIKLGLNSLYGKLAQQLGWRLDPERGLKLPPYHQIEYAGYVTSHCRASVFRAISDVPHAVIAFETDAVFTSEPLSLPIGSQLGEWERTEFDSITYIKSGFWYGTSGGKLVTRTRGIDPDSVTREDFIAVWESGLSATVPATDSRFVGMSVALIQGMEKWRTWRREVRQIVPFPSGKRTPWNPDARTMKPGRLYETECPYSYRSENISQEFPIEWLVQNAMGDDYAELRRETGWED